MYQIRTITSDQILTVYRMKNEGRARKEIAQAVGFTIDKVKQIVNTLNSYLVDLKKPSKEAYVVAIKTILKENNQEELWDKMTSRKSQNRKYTAEQIVAVWNLREKEGKSFDKINKELSINQTYTLYQNLKRLMEWNPDAIESATDEYKQAVEIIKGDGIENKSGDQATMLTSTIIIKIWQMQRGHFSSRGIAESLGWLSEGSTDYVRTVGRNLECYLSNSIFQKLKGRKKAYMDAREYIIATYPEEAANKYDVYLRHSTKGDYIEAYPTIAEEEDPEFVYQQRMKQTERQLIRVITKIVRDAISQSPMVEEPSKPEFLPIDDDGAKGYLLSAIKKYFGKNYKTFSAWYHQQRYSGGIYINPGTGAAEYYFLKKHVEEYLEVEQSL